MIKNIAPHPFLTAPLPIGTAVYREASPGHSCEGITEDQEDPAV